MTDQPNGEITVGSEKITISGSAYEDLRPLVQGVVGIASPLIHVVANLSSLSADWAIHKINKIGRCYEEKLTEVPSEHRQLPPLEISASVIRNAAVSSDATELQELFAELLTSASDKRRVESTHPSFANIIFELEPFDAKILQIFREIGLYNNVQAIPNFKRLGLTIGDQKWSVSVSNLERQGLVYYEQYNFGREFNEIHSAYAQSDFEVGVNDIVKVLTQMEEEYNNDYRSIFLTPFGRRFVSACIQVEPVEDKS